MSGVAGRSGVYARPIGDPFQRMCKFLPPRPVGDGCQEWTGARSKGGYGQLRVNGTLYYAHHLVWEALHGPIPPGMHVLHTCDNPPCSRGDHLFLGTHADNMADMKAKGRRLKGALR